MTGRRDSPFAYRCRMGWSRPILLFTLLAAGCGRVTDRRLLGCPGPPVLHEGLEIEEIRVAPRGRSGLRIDYASTRAGHRAALPLRGLRVSGATFGRDRLDLVAVETDGGTAGEARLPSSSAILAGAGHEVAPLPERCKLPAAMAYALQQPNALALAAVTHCSPPLFADLRPGRADQSRVRRDRGAPAFGAIGGVTAASRSASATRSARSRWLASQRRSRAAGAALVGRAVVEPLHAPPARPAFWSTAAVALSISEFVRASRVRARLVAAGVQSADRIGARAGLRHP
jgi:hypothetical protein